MFLAIIKWIFFAPVLLLGKLAVYPLAPIFALPPFVRMAEESETTGYPSQWPGKPRAFLIPALMWAQTHDDCLDAYWTAKRFGRWIERYSQEYFDTHWWLRYYCYVAWLWRNSAYGLAHSLGFDQEGLEILSFKDDGTWNQPVNDYFYYVVKNAKGQKAFEFKFQWFYSKKRYLQVRIGWGVFRDSPKKKGMLYVRVLPFKKVPK